MKKNAVSFVLFKINLTLIFFVILGSVFSVSFIDWLVYLVIFFSPLSIIILFFDKIFYSRQIDRYFVFTLILNILFLLFIYMQLHALDGWNPI
jgi:hypothetical protein